MAATSLPQRNARPDGLPLPDLYARVSRHIPAIEWPALAPDIEAILRLKRERNAVILAHNYQAPEIFHTVADIVGDSLALAREAITVDADVIVLAGVHFMAETAKLLNPNKTVLIPDMRAGCSLADSITAADIRALRQKYPGVPVVTYVNTSAAVKAESDICCTSGNAADVVRSLGVPRVLMLPDEFLAQNIQLQVPEVEMLTWAGHCEVHERFTPDDIAAVRDSYPGITVIAHPECPPDVVQASDFSGSTAMMMNYVTQKRPSQVVLVTECSMADNIAVANPDIEFIKPCNMCPHMKRMSLGNIRHALETMTHEIIVEPTLAERARRAVERMLAVKPTAAPTPVLKS
ncbi:quinolinate synthase NadA [Methylobacterium haplocladii]|uniref:Quinolinate synthase n=1 Tax=Methylobacterium haplocladii TaxID=1176176 RepID=A0A512IPX6_9HYPH|nr:quinolinate synthase NadA [Methylobacterium haplocladii]GEO99766.1 quinolinate synthase A [Methylobacterium haplocladii]GJD84602.1 Quinolinate synthase A [Methylobacterium haplocladii]GLS60159.1 quinolinate synthase A [Methylobacterium haplocladii]